MNTNNAGSVPFWFRFIVAVAACVATVHVATGCAAFVVGAAAGAGAATVAYAAAPLETEVEANPESIKDATTNAFHDMQIVRVSAAATALDARITGRTATGSPIEVVAKTRDNGGCKVSIRFGSFGDEVMSRKLLAEIEKNLAATSSKA